MTTTVPDSEAGLFDVFDRDCDADPARPAIIEGAHTMTYADLRAQVDALAARLHGLGVGSEDVVGVCLPRSRWSIVAALAVLRAGAVYCPLPTDIPAHRMQSLTARARPRAVIATSETADLFAGVTVISPTTTHPSHRFPTGGVIRPATAAAIVFTSGSTGTPKGVVDTYAALAHHLNLARHRFGIDGTSIVLFKTATTFDLSFYEMLLPPLSGATVIVAPPGDELDPDALLQRINHHHVTFLTAVPTMLALLVAHTGTAAITALQTVVACGERLDASLAAAAHRAFPRAQLINAYGPTEATVAVTTAIIDTVVDNPVTVGHPLPGTAIRVLDNTLRHCTPAQTGDIYLTGTQLARGYLGAPDMTSTRFVADPVGDHGETMYHTGDRGYRTSGGHIYVTGRNDSQVKYNGHRIELPGIETILLSHPAVTTAAVIPEHRDGVVTQLHAHVGGDTDPQTLRQHLLHHLPPSHIPSPITVHATLPTTTAGKIDRNALRTTPATTAPGEFPPPAHPQRYREPLAEQLLELISTISGHHVASLDANLVSEGLTSATSSPSSPVSTTRGTAPSPPHASSSTPLHERSSTRSTTAPPAPPRPPSWCT